MLLILTSSALSIPFNNSRQKSNLWTGVSVVALIFPNPGPSICLYYTRHSSQCIPMQTWDVDKLPMQTWDVDKQNTQQILPLKTIHSQKDCTYPSKSSRSARPFWPRMWISPDSTKCISRPKSPSRANISPLVATVVVKYLLIVEIVWVSRLSRKG